MDNEQREEIRILQKVMAKNMLVDSDQDEYEPLPIETINSLTDNYVKLQKVVNEADRIEVEKLTAVHKKDWVELGFDAAKIVLPVAGTVFASVFGARLTSRTNLTGLKMILGTEQEVPIISKGFNKWNFMRF